MSRTIELWRRAGVVYSDQPPAPVAPVASGITQTGVTMTWAPVVGADWYRLEISPAGAGTWVLSHQGGGLTKVVSGLTSSTSYDFRLAAFAGGEFGSQSEWSATTNMTTAGAAAPPGTPAAPAASNVSETTATLTVTAVATATSYGWQRSATSGTTGFATVTGTGLSINDSGMVASTNYWYRVRASNADGDSAYSTATAITTDTPPLVVPVKPADPVLAAQTPTSNDIQLTAVATATSYQLQRSLTGTAPWANVNIGPQLLVTDVGRTPGATYHYRYSASNAAGEGPQSDTLTTTNPTTLANVQPVSALSIVTRSGVATHPTFSGVWTDANADDIISRVASMGMKFIRGMLPPTATADIWANALRANGVKWLMTVVPEDTTSPTTQTVAETTAKVVRIRDNYADVCAGIEGLNEPNHNRGGGTVPANWATIAVNHQQAIWNASATLRAAGAVIVGPSLHDVATQNSYENATASGGLQHWHQLLDEGVLAYQDMTGLHTYPGGGWPIRNLDERLAYMHLAFGAGYPTWCTEWGYHNSLTTAAGHVPVTENVGGIYGPRGYLQYLTTVKPDGVERGELYLTYYEALDDYDPSADESNHENHFGLYGVSTVSAIASENPATWRAKPIVTSISAMLNAMQDPDGTAPYTPALVVCDVSSPSGGAALQWQVVARKAQSDNGTASVFVWRNAPEPWNRNTQTEVTVPAVAVDIRDRVGVRRVNVGASVFRMDLR